MKDEDLHRFVGEPINGTIWNRSDIVSQLRTAGDFAVQGKWDMAIGELESALAILRDIKKNECAGNGH